MTEQELALKVRGLMRHFGGITAVDDVSMDVAHGERRAIIGPNGAGKTTLFRVIAGEYKPSAGSIEALGQDVTALSVAARARLGLGRTFQSASVFDGLTVRENLQLALLGRQRGHLSLRLVSRRHSLSAEALSERIGLAARLADVSRDLSHGERRQLELGMALAGDPQLLMLDEPAAGLATEERGKLVELLHELGRERTLLLIEHDMEVALGIADRVTMLHDGKVVAEGTPEEMQANPLVHRLYLGGQTATAVTDDA